MRVETERMWLIPCSEAVARTVTSSRRQAEALLGLHIHPDWPGADIRGYLPYYVRQLSADPSRLGWGIWLMIQRAERLVFGDVGFKGKPDSSGTIDLGYGLVPAYRRRGYGFEAALALRDWAFTQPGVRRITADCLPENVGSARILQKLGMKRIGISDDGLWLWEYVP
jgi:ribosomal-protein-alanine N-acetyltransferase